MFRIEANGFTLSRLGPLALTVAVATAQFVGISHVSAAQPLGNAEVAIVTDNTFNDVCSFELSNDDGTVTFRDCAPGTVIKVERVQESSAASLRGASGVVVPLTGVASTDEGLIENAVATLRYGSAAMDQSNLASSLNRFAARQTCTSRNDYSISGTYGVGSGVQVNYFLRYDIVSNCSITDIFDRSREINGNAYWINSCSNANSNCYARGINLSTSFTGLYSVPNAYYNNEYRNRSNGPACCTTYYGYYTYTYP